jgi:GNAT superfamily N-acetyltransferase
MDEVTVRPATAEVWSDVETLLGVRGSARGCWCMFFRQSPQQRRTDWGEGNRLALARLVESGGPPGLLAYRAGTPVGWVSIAPRDVYVRLDRSPISKRLDDQPVWAMVCLFVTRTARGTGVARALLRSAVDFARDQGAQLVEAYPVDDTMGPVTADDAYHGLVSLLSSEGFCEVARRSPRRPVMRFDPAAADLSWDRTLSS